jgi:ABC-type transport system involved in multi-copper enzyme maturation permease subunit
MGRILSIAANTYREAIRNRVLYVVLAFAAFFLFACRFLGSISVGQDVKIIKDMGLAAISLFSVLIAILVGTNIVFQEIERRTIYTILSKPVRRAEFVLGKYLGLCATLATAALLMSALFALQVHLIGDRLSWPLAAAIGMILLELFLITSVAVLLSCFASPLLSAVFTFGFYVIGHTIRNLLALLGYIESGAVRKLLSLLYFVLPNLDNFNIHREVVHGLPLPWDTMGWAALYGILYIAAMLLLASLVLGRRDL